MKTVKDLGLISFNEKSGVISKQDCPPAATISFEDYIMSKEPGRTSKAVPYSGHQITNGIFERIQEINPDSNRKWGDIHVYRDKMTHPGYVTKMTKESSNSRLLQPDTPISELAFERFIGTIDIIGNNDHSARLAIKYEPDNFEMAFGFNVKVCQNFNILGADKHFKVARGVNYDDLMDQLESWLKGIESSFNTDLNTISRLSEKNINQLDTYMMLGELMQKYHRTEQVIQLTDISALSSNLIGFSERQGVNNLWDFTNAGTEVLRFDDNSGNAIFESIANFNNYILDKL